MTLTGGEPLLRDDIVEIATHAKTCGFTAAVATNGLLLTPELVRELLRAGVGHFDIGVESTFQEVAGGIAAAAASGASVTVSLCITSESHGMAGRVVGLAAALGADAVCLNRFVRTGRPSDEWLAPSKDQLDAAFISAGRAASLCSLPVYAGIPMEPCAFPRMSEWGVVPTACRCGDGKWAIGSVGGLRTCEQSGVDIGNLLVDDFSTLSRRSEVQLFRGRFPYDSCRGCAVRSECEGGCRFLTGQENS